MFCPVCLRTSYCPCESCIKRWPDDSPRYIRINMTEDHNNWDDKCPHCGFTASVNWWEDYDYRLAGYFNGTGRLGDMDLEKAKTNIYSTRIAINNSLDAISKQLEEEYEKYYK